jgi:hypothetical protein
LSNFWISNINSIIFLNKAKLRLVKNSLFCTNSNICPVGSSRWLAGQLFFLIMRTTLLLSYLLSTVCSLCGQTVYFSKQYSMFPDLPSVGGRVIAMPDGYAFTTLEGASNNRKGSVLVITDKQGNFVHTKQFLPTGNNITGLSYHPDDSTFHIWGDYFVGAGQNLYRPYMLKTNWCGDTIWRKEVNHTAYNLCRNAIELPDGGFIMALTTSIPYPDTSIIGLVRIDSMGNELWHKKYGSGFYQYETYGLHLKNDSTLIVGYNAYYKIIDTLQPPYDGYGFLEMDLDGNVLQDTVLFIQDAFWGSNWTGWLLPIGESRLAFVNRTRTLDPKGLQWINAVDMDYNFVWKSYTSDYNISFPEYIPAFAINDKKNVVGGGISAAETLMPHLFEMDSNGNLLWERLARPPIMGQDFIYGSSFESVRQTDDGGYIIVGNFQHPDGTFQTWFLKLDSLGCFEPGCQTGNYLTTGVENQPISESDHVGLMISPNPADDLVQINPMKGRGRLFITDVQGRPLDTEPISIDGGLRLGTHDWPPGAYVIRYIGEKGALLGINKLIIMHNK